jgi:hypothetical protein
MTYIYEWFQFPTTFSVVCPNCGNESQCTEIPILKNNTPYSPETNSFQGKITCTHCGFNKEKTITWPEDAFWKFTIHGKILWAWSADHAKAIADYINAKDRDEFKSTYAASLFRIPEYFKLAKHRALIVKKIHQKLNNHH